MTILPALSVIYGIAYFFIDILPASTYTARVQVNYHSHRHSFIILLQCKPPIFVRIRKINPEIVNPVEFKSICFQVHLLIS